MKKDILVRAPALSMSGYGEQARFLLRALANREDVEIYLKNTPWGSSGNITEYTKETDWIKSLIAKTSKKFREDENFRPEMSVQVTIPNEWENLADINIGYTAGIECDRVSPSWIEKANFMNKVVTISQHSEDVFKNTHYDVLNNEDDEVVAELKLKTPIDHVGYGARQTIRDKNFKLDLPTDFNFLTVAQLGPRKNIEVLMKSFLGAFQNNEKVGLIIKGFSKNNSISDKKRSREMIKSITNQYPNRKCKIYLLHGEMSRRELTSLYKHSSVKSYITTTHGEGFGLPIFEAASAGLPVVAPNWSGHKDFLNFSGHEELFCEIPFYLDEVSKESRWPGVIEDDARWSYVKEEDVSKSMNNMYENYKKYKRKAGILKKNILRDYNEKDKLTELSEKILNVNTTTNKQKGEEKT